VGELTPSTAFADIGEEDRGGARAFAAVVRRWRWMIVIAAVAAGVAGYVVASGRAPSYTSRAVLLVGPINTDNADTLKASGQLAQTYAELASSRPVLDATSRRAGGVRGLADSVTASASAVTRLLTISVSTRDAALSARIANAEAAVLVAVARQDAQAPTNAPAAKPATPAKAAPDSGSLRVVDPADAASSPSGHSALGIALIAAVGGLLGALGLAVLLDRSGDSIGDLDELRAVTGAGVLGTIGPAVLAPARGRTVRRSDEGRRLRLLASKLGAIGERSLLVVVPDADAAPFTAHLADALVDTGVRVAVVGGGDEPAGGPAAKVLAVGEALASDPADGPSRYVRHPLGEARAPEAARELLDDLLAEADVVLVAAPALQQEPGALMWARVVDGTILALSLERAGRAQLSAVVDNLHLVHARVLGTVVASRAHTGSRRA
jgi:capsular polysaccharide biosynthesis protein